MLGYDSIFRGDIQPIDLLVGCGDNRMINLRDQIRSYFRQRDEDGVDL